MSAPAQTLGAAEIQAMFDRSPFIAFLGCRVVAVDAEAESITVEMPMRPELERRPGTSQFHGGPIAALIDTVGDFAVALKLGGGVPTINFRTDYLRPATGEALTATARTRRLGRTVAVVDIDVTDGDGRLVAVGRGTYASQVG